MLKAAYTVFLTSTAVASAIGVMFIWDVVLPGETLYRVLGTAIVLAFASALTISATRMVNMKQPPDLG